jgi:hypothetical protein
LILDGEVGEARANFIIVEPSILIPTTQIVKASKCRRKAYLGHLYKGLNGDLNYAQVLGNIVHEIFQSILSKMDFKKETKDATIKEAI